MTTYTVHFFHPQTGETLEVADNRTIVSLEYTRAMNVISNFSITLDASSRLSNYLEVVDILAEVYRVNYDSPTPEKEGTYLLRFAEVFQDENQQEFIILTGFSLEHLLKRRAIVVEDDATGAGGYSTKANLASNVVYEFIRDQCVTPALNTERAFPNFSIDDPGLFGNYVFQRVQYTNLWETVQECIMRGEIDVRLVHNGDTEIEAQIDNFGSDFTRGANEPYGLPFVLFNLPRGNIINPSLTLDRREEVNFCYSFGQGPEEDREIVPYASPAASDSKWNRIEDTTDANNNELGDFEGLVIAAEFFIRENAMKRAFTFELDEREIIQGYNVRWTIGDYVTGAYYGFEVDLRVMSIKVSLKDNDEEISVVLAEPETFVDPEIAILAAQPREDIFGQAVRQLAIRIRTMRQRTKRLAANAAARAEIGGAAPRRLHAQIDQTTIKVGQHYFVTDGRKPGEGAGAGTGVPASWDGNDLISDYDAQPVVV